MNGNDSFVDVKNRAIDQCDRPDKITRKEAEEICRSVIRPHLGEKLQENLFKDSVDQLMEEINGAECKEV